MSDQTVPDVERVASVLRAQRGEAIGSAILSELRTVASTLPAYEPMKKWRIIGTDTEGATGVAPICDQPDVHAMMHGGSPDDLDVYDECCPEPHIECWTEEAAKHVCDALNLVGASICD